MGGNRSIASFFKRRKKPLLILAGLGGILFYFFWTALPGELFPDPLSPVLFSVDDRLLDARIAADEQWRFPPHTAVPDKFYRVLIPLEDKRFYLHPGVDPLALLRALFLNIKRGRIVSGGSSLTMQVIRLSRQGRRRTVWEKIREMILALRLEISHSKKGILRLYAAHAPFGGNVVGLDAASWMYFGRNPDSLSWAEAAFLAVLPNDPGLIKTEAGRDRLRLKRNRLLKRLLAKRIISKLEWSLALTEPIPRGFLDLPDSAPHLLQTLATKHPDRALFATRVRGDLQGSLSRVCREHARRLLARDIRNLAAVVIDNRQAAVVAYVGNSELNHDKDSGQALGPASGQADRPSFGQVQGPACGQDIDLVQRPRSTGSILKPMLYAAMLQEGGLTLRTLVADVPVNFRGYSPENFDRRFRGAVRAQDALAWSLNVPAVRLLHQYGMARFYNLLKRCGLTSLWRPVDDYGLTLILGGAEGTLFEITAVYAKMAQLVLVGERHAREITLLKGEAPLPADVGGLGAAASYLTFTALTEARRPDEEGFWKNFASSRWVAWKTGTSYGMRDAWAVGVTPNFTIGVWAGNADGEGKSGLTGLTVAAPLLFDIVNSLDCGDAMPNPWLLQKQLTVCRLSGFLAGDLCPAEYAAVPVESHFDQICPHHQLVHLDAGRRFRVDSRCEPVDRMVHQSWFTLPAVQEYYYQRFHPEYKRLPPIRPDCQEPIDAAAGAEVMNVIYPERGTKVYIPVDLDGRPSQVVFHAVHRDPEATLFWHLDDRYLAATVRFHKISLCPGPGAHTLLLMDESGRRFKRKFFVLNQPRTAAAD